MRSKTSRHPQNPPFLLKAELNCAEAQISALAAELAQSLKPGDRVLLEGPMGAGKSFFARSVLHALGVRQPPEGSPSFALAHEYEAPIGDVVHIDFYRLKSEIEIEEAGITAYFWERDSAIILSEWTSLWSDFEAAVLRSSTHHRNWRVNIDFAKQGDAEFRRDIRIVLTLG